MAEKAARSAMKTPAPAANAGAKKEKKEKEKKEVAPAVEFVNTTPKGEKKGSHRLE